MDIQILKNCSYCDTEHPEFQAVAFETGMQASVSVLLGSQMIGNDDAEEYVDQLPEEVAAEAAEDDDFEVGEIIIAPAVATAAEVATEEQAVEPVLETPETEVETSEMSDLEAKEALVAMPMDELRVIGAQFGVRDNNKSELADKIIAAHAEAEQKKIEEEEKETETPNNPFADK